MNLLTQISTGKFFTLIEGLEIAEFVKIDRERHEGMNSYCINGCGASFEKGISYYIEDETLVIPTITKQL